MQLQPGDPAPDFTAETDGGNCLRLSDLRGKKVVLYFYPRDNTAGCSAEAREFRDARNGFADKNALVLGVSPDSVRSHDRFKAKHGLPFTLVSDPRHEISESYGAWREKRLFGKRYLGVVRSTFVIDEQGIVQEVYDNVRVEGHVAAVLERL